MQRVRSNIEKMCQRHSHGGEPQSPTTLLWVDYWAFCENTRRRASVVALYLLSRRSLPDNLQSRRVRSASRVVKTPFFSIEPCPPLSHREYLLSL